MSIEKYLETQNVVKEKRYKKIIRYFFASICFFTLVFSLSIIYCWYKDNLKTKNINKKIEENISIYNSRDEGELVNPPDNKNSNYYNYINTSFYQVNFSVLSYLNSDTVAFLYLRNTNVKYPVVQSSDNNFYLKHSFDKTENNAGWIFMDYRNNINNLDDNIVIYGHSRLNGTMFGSLRNLLSINWQSNPDNYVIFLSTPKENMIFLIFSIYTIESENYYITTNFNNDNDKQKWINTMKERNIAPINTEVNVNDKFLTLSTCQNNQNGRIVIQAKLIKRQKNKT